MAKKITFKSGGTTLNMGSEFTDMAESIVNKLLPATKKKLETELERIEADAKQRWLVREKGSQGSREKVYSEIILSPTFELIGVVGNTAPYAWAIRVGKDTQDTGLTTKKRLSNELLFKPVKKKADAIAETLALEITKKTRK